MLLLKVVDALDKHKVSYAIAGGFALVLQGYQRGTIDIDLVLTISEKNFERAEKALLELNLSSRLPLKAQDVVKFREEYIENRNLIAWSFVNFSEPSEMVDLILVEDLKNLSFETKNVLRHKVRVLTKESLIKMKEKTGRPQDQEDVRALRKLLK